MDYPPARTPQQYTNSSSDLARLNRESVGPDAEVDELKAVCLQMVLTVFRDVEMDYVLALINAVVMNKSNVHANAEDIIHQLLEMESYPKEPSMPLIAGPVEGPTTEAGHATRASQTVTRSSGLVVRRPLPASAAEGVFGQAHQVGSRLLTRFDVNTIPPDAMDWPPQVEQYMPSSVVESGPSHTEASHDRSHIAAVQNVTTPWDDPWRETPVESAPIAANPSPQVPVHNTSSLSAAPPIQTFTGPDLSLVTSPTHNAWSESPEKETPADYTPPDERNASQSRSWSNQTTASPERSETARRSAHLNQNTVLTCSDSDSDSDVFFNSPTVPDLSSHHGPRNPRVQNRPATPPPRVGFARTSRPFPNNESPYNVPSTLLPYRRRNVQTSRDTNPSARIAERRSARRPFSPVNIEGGWEFVDATESTYGDDVSTGSSENPWAQYGRSAVQSAAPLDQVVSALGQGERRRHVRFRSPGVETEDGRGVGSESEMEEDDDPPVQYANYQGSPERRRKEQQAKGGTRSGP